MTKQQSFRINGRVINRVTGAGIPNLRVEAWDWDLIFKDFVGSDQTDAEGKFFIEFTSEFFREFFFDRKPDLFFRVFSGEELIEDTRESVMWNVSAGEIPVEIPVSWSAPAPPVSPPDVTDEEAPDFGPTKTLENLFPQDVKIAKAIKERIGKQTGKKVLEVQDLVALNAKDWEKLLEDASVPSPGKVTREEYAARITRKISNWYPTAALFHRLKPLPRDEIRARVEELRPLIARKEGGFRKADFDELAAEGMDEQELDLLKSAHSELSRLANRYPGLDLGAVLDDSKISSSEKASQITERIGWVEQVRQNNPNVELLALDYTPDAADLNGLKTAGLTTDARKKVVATLKSYQRTFALTADVQHANALLDAGYYSASSIVRDRPDAFAQKTGLREADALNYFDMAEDTAAKASLAMTLVVDQQAGGYNSLKVSNDSPAIEDHLKKLDGFADLFGSQSSCQCEHCQSILSPAAYFVDLMCFVEEHILNYFTGTRAADTLNLKHSKRRPDLWKLELTCENTNKEIPTLDVINEILENSIDGTGSSTNRATVEQRVYEQVLSSTVSSFRQPFWLPLKRLDTYLRYFERTRATVARTVGAPMRAVTTAQLKISGVEYDLIRRSNVDPGSLTTLYGIQIPPVAAAIGVAPFDAHLLLKPMGLSRAELGDLVVTRFVTAINTEPISITAEKTNSESVQNDIERIHDLTLPALDRMHRFVRLWRQMQWQRTGEKENRTWSIAELDLVISRLAGSINENSLAHMATLLSLQERFGTSVEELCAIWSNIPATSVAKDRQSLFDRLFNLPSFVTLDGTFPKTAKFVHPSLKEAAPPPVDYALLRLLAGLRVNDEELYLLILNLSAALAVNVGAAAEADRGFTLSVANLTLLYRHARIAEWLRLTLPELFQLINFAGVPQKYIASLSDLNTLLDLHDWWKTTDYSLDDLAFITQRTVTRRESYPDSGAIANQLIQEVQTDGALVFAETIFAAVGGVTEQESRDILAANNAGIEALSDGGYRLRPSFDPATLVIPPSSPITIPPTFPITRADANAVLEKYHASRIVPSRLAGKLGIPIEKLSVLLQMVRQNLSSSELVSALQGGSPDRLRNLIQSVLPLHVLFRSEVFDVSTLSFIRNDATAAGANGGIFAISDFSSIELSSVRKLSIYKSFVDFRDAAKFSLAEPQKTAADVQEILTSFTPAQGFGVNNPDPQIRLTTLGKVARVVGAEPSLVATVHANVILPQTAPEALLKLSRCVELAKYLGVSGETLKIIVSESGATPPEQAAQVYAALSQASDAILSAIRAKYADEKEWQTNIEPYEDMIRSAKRAALVDYLIHNFPEFKTTNDLFNHLLIDVQLEGCARTSRVVAAISSVQLYVHRVLMNLEQDSRPPGDPERIQVQLGKEFQDEWSWRKNYRVWEANRKVFLFPENYIEPELRDDKTPLFEELESTLLQQEINEQTVLDAYARYMSGFEEVARLKIAGAYHDNGPESDVLHLFGVTPGDPPTYYYRTVENIYHSQSADGKDLGIVWNSWRKIEVQIPVRKVSPIVYRGKLYVFWVEFVTTPTNSVTGGESKFTGYKHKMSLKFTSLRLDGTWTPPQAIALPPRSRYQESPPAHGEIFLESSKFPFRGDSGVIPDPLAETDEVGDTRPRYGYDSHDEPKEGYTLSGFLWDQVYPETLPEGLIITGANHRLRHAVDFYRRQLLQIDVPVVPNAVWGLHAGYGVSDERALFRGYIDRPGSPFRYSGYGLCSLLLEHSRVDEWRRLRYASGGPTLSEVTGWLGLEQMATLPLQTELDVINSNTPISDFLIDVDGDLFLLQGTVRTSPKFLLRRLGTTLAETIGQSLSVDGLDAFLSIGRQQTFWEAALPITELVDVDDATVKGKLDFTGPYGVYYREIFFHIPFLIANHLNSKQRFAASQRWYHYLFDPTASEIIPNAERDRNWRYLEFRNQALPKLRTMLTGDEANAAIEVYKKDPFNPHAIARLRITAYQKCIVMKYIDNLLDWGDSLFAQFTREAINEAMLLYVMAQDILGERPVELGECGGGNLSPKSYETIKPWIKEGSEFLAELESYYWSRNPRVTAIPKNELLARAENATTQAAWKDSGSVTAGPSVKDDVQAGKFEPFRWNQTYTSSWQSKQPDRWGRQDVVRGSDHSSPLIDDFARARGFTWNLVRQISPVFCVPSNKELRSYWDRVEDRLYKIRHCMDISGVRRELALFAPEIDPRLLVKARAAGLSLEDVLNAISGDLPPYRFAYLIEKAKGYASTVQSFGGALLSALEKKDVEELTRLRTVHEQNILKLTTQIRQWEIDTITEEIISIERRKATVEYRKGYYEGLINADLTPWERTQQISHHLSSVSMILGSVLDGSGGVLNLLPQLGSPFSMKYGGAELGASAEAWAKVAKDTAGIAQIVAGSAGLEAGFDRRREDWKHQGKLAGRELAEIEKQLAVANLRKQIAEEALQNHNKSVEQQEEVFDFYGDKFSNLGLYTWLSTTLQRLHREAYNSAFAMARLAEQAFRFERGDDAGGSIGADYWEASKAGLLAGERLLVGLQNLERRFIETNYRDLEVTQSFSLAQINPAQLINLRETASCTFDIPEFFLDLCYPGHYRRLIKAVRLTMPCVTGPYANVGATLTLSASQVRMNPNLGEALVTYPPRRSVSIATSNAQNDGGVFEFNFRDERYMPFEGAGAISTWNLALPKTLKQFDYQTISDVILHVSYTAEHDEGLFRGEVEREVGAATGSLMDYVTKQPLMRAFSLRQDFPNAFHKLVHSPVNTEVKIDLSEKYFPYFLMGKTLELQAANLAIRTKPGQPLGDLQFSINGAGLPTAASPFARLDKLGGLRSIAVTGAFGLDPIREHVFTIKKGGDLSPTAPLPPEPPAIDAAKLLDVLLYLEYKVTIEP